MINIYNLENMIAKVNNEDKMSKASVLIPFYKEIDWEIYFIKRIDDGSIHSAQVAFPGGKKEFGDKTLKDTALRETYEEIGIEPKQIEIITQIEPTTTLSSNFNIYPFVGIIHSNEFKLSKKEVQYIFSIPLDFLLKIYPFTLRKFEYKGRIFNTYLIDYAKEIIWGATARILNNLLEKLVKLESKH